MQKNDNDSISKRAKQVNDDTMSVDNLSGDIENIEVKKQNKNSNQEDIKNKIKDILSENKIKEEIDLANFMENDQANIVDFNNNDYSEKNEGVEEKIFEDIDKEKIIELYKSLCKEYQESKDQRLRLAAELQNTRTRLEKEKLEAIKFASSGFARDLLSVADNFDRAFSALAVQIDDKDELEDKESLNIEEAQQFIKGISLTKKELLSVFKRHGLEKIKALGEVFDPNFHQAIGQVEAGENEKTNIVKQIMQDGYVHNNRVLRASMVVTTK